MITVNPQLGPKRRYSPAIRRTMILDAAAELVEREGIWQLSMERVASHADISKALIYKYFNNVESILQELLTRELKQLRKEQAEAAEKAQTFDELVRGVTSAYLRNIAQKGLLIERLQADPSISNSSDPTDFQREGAVEYIAAIVQRNFGIPMETARAVTDISFGVPSAAGAYLLRHDVDLDDLVDLTVSMIIGSVNGVRNDYMTRKMKLNR
jgi:TetR/AcrR family transcriptional regulator, fatty acid biosynthesis regulator